jgi:hypothetical protein
MRTREELVEAALAGARRTEEGFVRATDLCRANDPTVGVIMQANPEINKQVWWGTAGGSRCYVTRTDVARAILAHLPTNKLRRHAAAPSTAPAAPTALAAPSTAPTALAAPSTASQETLEERAAVQEAQPTPDATPSNLQEQLCTLLGRPVQLRLRTTSDGLVSLIDVTMFFTGLNNDNAGDAVRRLMHTHPDFRAECAKFKFPGRGRQTVDVAPLPIALEFAFLLPGRHAAQVRRQAAVLMVRYLGGDAALVDEVYAQRRVQRALSALPSESLTPAQQAVRLCGEETERASRAAPLPPPPLRLPAAPRCLDEGPSDLYVIRIPGRNALRPGRAGDVQVRLLEHQRRYGADAHLVLHAPLYGHLETAMHRHLRPLRLAPQEELLDAERLSVEELRQLVPELQARAEEEARTTRSRKRSYEEAEMDLRIAELDAKTAALRAAEASAVSDRASAFQVVLELARAGQETAVAALVELLRR